MRNTALLVVAVTLASCASARQDRAAAFHREAPQLVASCNEAFGGTAARTRGGLDACRRLAAHDSLGLVDAAVAKAYVRLNARQASAPSNAPGPGNGTPSIGPGGAPQ
jgi:hypothetical protein